MQRRYLSMNSFCSPEELSLIGFGSLGKNVKISRKASFYSPERIFIADNVRIDDFCMLSGGSGLTIDSFVHVSAFVAMYAGSGIAIGHGCSISPFTAIFSECDDFSGESLVNPWYSRDFKPGYKAGKVILKDYVSVGSHCVIVPKVTLHEGAAVLANSLVLSDCEEWSIFCGTPAKKIKTRSKALLELERECLLKQHSRQR